ncbi:MAG: hypothetical protein IJ580_03475 [Prevotella sp.]|nr:hypothetical protein [Prevotella sp.]
MIVNVNMPKKDLVDKTTKFLAGYGLVDEKDLKLDEIDENTAEYSVPFLLRQPIQPAKMMGMPIAENPIQVVANLRFQFQDGGALVVIEDMSTIVFWTDPKASADKNPAYAKYQADLTSILAANNFFTRALVFANGGSYSDFKAKLGDYFGDIANRFKIYDEVVAEGTAKWLTNEEYIEQEKTNGFFKSGSKNQEMEINGLNKFLQEHRMFLLSESRWEKYVRTCFDNLFKAINAGVDGKITAVAEDGNTTWTMVDGALLPTDPKLQKKYAKKGLSFYNPE